MLEELLHLLARGGIHSYADLMARLSIDQPLLETLLDDLARRGYLQPVEANCGGQCSACSAGRCSITGPGRLWTLTEKGSLLAGQA
jgi:hypothetical protein